LKEYFERKRDILEPSVTPKVDYKNYLMLGYYRNPLNHIFFNEGLVILSITSFGLDKAWKGGVPLDVLF